MDLFCLTFRVKRSFSESENFEITVSKEAISGAFFKGIVDVTTCRSDLLRVWRTNNNLESC
jgi:hypothetical protein